MEAPICARAGCACPRPTEGGPFCSGYCANVAAHETERAACACGHEACNDAKRVPRTGKEAVTSMGGGPRRGVR